MKFKAFIFDMDGTLVDNMRVHDQSWVEVLASAGVQVEAEQFYHRTAGKPNAQILREFIGPHLSDEAVATYSDRKEALYRERFRPHLKAIDGLPEFLQAAKQLSAPMALATAAGRDNISFVLDGLGLRCFFEVVVGGDDIKHGKPNPEIFLTAAYRLGVPPEQCLVFEDAPAGIEAARRAGMRAVVLTTTLSAQELTGRNDIEQIVQDYTALNPAKLLSEDADPTAI